MTNEKSNRLSNSLVISPTRTAHGRKEVMKTTMDSFEDFLSRKQTFSEVSQERIKEIEYLLNSRPRKRFGGKIPYAVFFEQTGVALDC